MSEEEKLPTEKPQKTRYTLEGFFDLLDQLPGYKIVEDHSDYESTYNVTYTDPQDTHRISVDAEEVILQEGRFGKVVHIIHQIEDKPLITEIFLTPAEYSTKLFVDINGQRVPVGKIPAFETQTHQILEITKGALDIVDYSRHLTSRNPNRLRLIQYNGENLRKVCYCLPYKEDPYYDPIYLGRLTIKKALENKIPERKNTTRIF